MGFIGKQISYNEAMKFKWTRFYNGRSILVWQFLFILLNTSWLLAPHLNHQLSYRTTLISQYETPGQPFSWLFRICDVAGAVLLIALVIRTKQYPIRRIVRYLLLLIAIGMLMDPIWTTSCYVHISFCRSYTTPTFVIHAIETAVTAGTVFVLALYDMLLRKRLVSIAFVVFQICYGILNLTHLASIHSFNTISQYIYQLIVVIWIAWFCRDYLWPNNKSQAGSRESKFIKRIIATWAFISGLLAIVVSLGHIDLFGRIDGLYFAGNNDWLAQHGVVVGIIMLYLSRHLARGELRARQIFLAITGFETLKYAVLTPNLPLVVIYLLTFCSLFVLYQDFQRGVSNITIRLRLRDTAYMIGALLVAGIILLSVLEWSPRLARITQQSLDNFSDYALTTRVLSTAHAKSALLAHILSAFVITGIGVILWILFRPYKQTPAEPPDIQEVEQLLQKYSTSPEDYFKVWPADKDYFWSERRNACITYKITGTILYAIADPIGPKQERTELIKAFCKWANNRRLKVCFLPINESNLSLYDLTGLNSLQIGANALVDIDSYLQTTARDKWWRWQKNRSIKTGYEYRTSQPPHTPALLAEFQQVSDAWLSLHGRKERSFAIGYYDTTYINRCVVGYLVDAQGSLIAFTNHLPTFRQVPIASVDLLRYVPTAASAMPYLLYKTIENMQTTGQYKYFDLGFVPFASAKSPIIAIIRKLGAKKFSARGLEQFKNKFDPEWQPVYVSYDGDIGDLALIVANLEPAMRLDS